jgi:glycosyltransferase involved in cell wall biosynthesis
MKVLIATRAPYHPASRGGPAVVLKHLARSFGERGHQVVHIASAFDALGHREHVQRLRATGLAVESTDGVDVWQGEGQEIHGVTNPQLHVRHLSETIDRFRPDGILSAVDCLAPSDEPLLASDPMRRFSGRVLHLLCGAVDVPFGPLSFRSRVANPRQLDRADRLISVSKYVASYVEQWSKYTSEVFYPPQFGVGPFPNLLRADGLVTLVNAGKHKGISIFLELARRMPEVGFAAVPSWDTTPPDLEALAQLPNVRILPFSPQINDIFSKTRILLVPSIVPEGFALVVVEAMLRGIPVVASDAGALPEAKLGTRHLVPVHAIEKFGEQLDPQGRPVVEIPPQDIQPWIDALNELSDPIELQRQSEEARRAATAFANSLTIEPLERLFGWT